MIYLRKEVWTPLEPEYAREVPSQALDRSNVHTLGARSIGMERRRYMKTQNAWYSSKLSWGIATALG
jgi:hypothetical protein